MGALAPAIPILKVVGAIIGAVLTAKTIDDTLGSPLQRSLGLDLTLGSGSRYEVRTRDAFTTDSTNRTEGLRNYLHSLEALAPGFVDRNRMRLTANYSQAIDRREDELVEGVKALDIVDNPLFIRPNYKPSDTHLASVRE